MNDTFSSQPAGGIREPRRLDGYILSRTRSGRALLARKPGFDPRLKYSGKKNSVQEELRHAVTYAGFASDQPIYQCRAVGSSSSAYQLAVADYLGKPQVLDIDIRGWSGKAGQSVLIEARDNFVVLRVCLVIWDGSAILDQGEAEQSSLDGLVWKFNLSEWVTRRPGLRLEALAYDLPGNVSRYSIELR